MMKDTMTPGPAISLATSPDTTYIPVPTQLPTPSDTRSTVDSTRASLVPWELVPDMAVSNMDSTGLVLRTREVKVFHFERHCILRGSSFPARLLILRAKVKRQREEIHKEEVDAAGLPTLFPLPSSCCLAEMIVWSAVQEESSLIHKWTGENQKRSDVISVLVRPFPVIPQSRLVTGTPCQFLPTW